MAGPRESNDSTGAPLCCECWRRIDGDGVSVTHPFGLAAYHRACYKAQEGKQYRGKRP
jgi:hypothetical protein